MVVERLRSVFRRRGRIPPLPESFTFGVACADHQVEAYDPEREDVWDEWERRRGLTPRGRATDFWNRYPEDVELARRLGCRAFRFSIAWSRVEPRPGQYDEAAFDHYRQLIATIRAAGMEPLVTLHHFAWPVHVEKQGGMIGDKFPALFERYAAEAAERLGDQVRYWVTFNEPTQLMFGYVKPWWERDYPMPPGLPEGATIGEQMEAVGHLMRNLFLAHAAGRRAIKQRHPQALVGANPLLLGFPVWLQRLLDWNATRVRRPQDLFNQGKRFAERPLLERGRVDAVVATLTVTPEREQQATFSEIYYVAGQMLLVPAASPVAEAQDLAGKTVAVVRGSTAERAVRSLVLGAAPHSVDDYAAAIEALDQGRADALLADDTILRGLMGQHEGRYRLIDQRLTDEPYAVAVAPGDPELFDAVNAAVHRFKVTGAWAASYARHLGEPVPEPPPAPERTLGEVSGGAVALAARERAARADQPLPPAPKGTVLRRIQDRGHLIVAVKQDVPGFGYREPTSGELAGLEIDLARELARGIFGDPERVRFHPAKTRERLPLLRSLLAWLDPLLKHVSIFSTGLTSNWWHMGMAGKLPEFLCPRECVGQQDFVGLDYYWGIRSLRLDRILALVQAAAGRFDRAPVWPGVLHGLLKRHAGLFPDQPILIGENGSVEVADGVDRSNYLQRHIRQVQRAARHGAQVEAYMCWSLTSNREWGHAFAPSNDFGLYHIDLDGDERLERVHTPSAKTYEQIVADRGA